MWSLHGPDLICPAGMAFPSCLSSGLQLGETFTLGASVLSKLGVGMEGGGKHPPPINIEWRPDHCTSVASALTRFPSPLCFSFPPLLPAPAAPHQRPSTGKARRPG